MENSVTKVLLVEDDEDHAALIRRRFRNAPNISVELVWRERVADAQQYLANHEVEAILLDLHLPDSDAPQDLIRRFDAISPAPIIVLTSLDDRELAVRAVRAGAQDYLLKAGIEVDTLERAVRYAIERKRIKETLQHSEERLSMALEGSRAGFWDLVVGTERKNDLRELFLSEQQREIIGFAEDMPADPWQWFQSRIHADDINPLRAAVREHRSGKTPVLEAQFRLQDNGAERWLYVRGNCTLEQHGSAQRWTGISWDITERKKHEEERFRLAAIVESSQDAIVATTLQGTITNWNHSAQQMYGYEETEVVGRPWSLLFADDEKQAFAILDSLADGIHIEQIETHHRHRNGNAFHVSVTASPILDDTGSTVGMSLILRDVSERKRLEAQLQHDADHDVLTGLPNRALFVREVEGRLNRRWHKQDNYAVLVIDLDNFKLVNDSMGHFAGDRLLVEFSRRLERCLTTAGCAGTVRRR